MKKEEKCNQAAIDRTCEELRINETVLNEVLDVPYTILKEQLDLGGVFPVRIGRLIKFNSFDYRGPLKAIVESQEPTMKKYYMIARRANKKIKKVNRLRKNAGVN